MEDTRVTGGVLCAIDDCGAARVVASVAARLARDLRWTALLVHVTRDTPKLPFGLGQPSFGKPCRVRRKLLAVREQHRFPAATSVRTGTGDPLLTLLAIAEQENARLMVVAARGRRRDAAALIGRVTSGLIRAAPCPVVVVPVGAVPPLDLPRMQDVVCGVAGDGSHIDLRVLNLAADLAARLRGDLHAVHGYKPGASAPAAPAPQRRLNETLDRSGVDARATLVPLPAAEALESIAEKRHARLIVVGYERDRHRLNELRDCVTIRLAAEGKTPLVVLPPTARLEADSNHYKLTA